MKRLCIICEGITESEFVKSSITPHLQSFQVQAYPKLLKTKPGKKGGGNVSIDRIAKHIQHEYHNADFLTTLVDYYGFKSKGGLTKQQLEDEILVTVSHWVKRYEPGHVIPYIQMHEFEALLFSDVSEFRWVLDGWNETAEEKLKTIARSFASPEEINDNPESAPSKRILKIFKKGRYGKTEHGSIIAQEIGLLKIRKACPNFNAWIGRLERLSANIPLEP